MSQSSIPLPESESRHSRAPSPKRIRRKGTKTSDFGSPGRIGHDASRFYSGRLYEGLPQEKVQRYHENPVPLDVMDTILCSSSENMEQLPDCSVHLMVTSPPYNVGKQYDRDLTLQEYISFLERVWKDVHRVLVPGGRAAINVANLGRKPYLPLHAYIVDSMVRLGFLMRGEVIWNKASSGSPSTAWGSWLSAANPTLRDIHEYILLFSKEQFRRKSLPDRPNTISRDEFLEFTKSVWTFPAESARRIGHPAPFPIELPYRLIQLFTFQDDIVLDPFMGSGQAAIAAMKTGRHYVGYDISPEYVDLAKRRIDQLRTQLEAPTILAR